MAAHVKSTVQSVKLCFYMFTAVFIIKLIDFFERFCYNIFITFYYMSFVLVIDKFRLISLLY